VCRDIEALFIASQVRVTGEVKVQYRPGNAFIAGVTSPYSLMAASKGVYGEAAGEWTAQDALGFSKMVGLPGIFWHRAGEKAQQGS
jgi:argininosuccinate synthase